MLGHDTREEFVHEATVMDFLQAVCERLFTDVDLFQSRELLLEALLKVDIPWVAFLRLGHLSQTVSPQLGGHSADLGHANLIRAPLRDDSSLLLDLLKVLLHLPIFIVLWKASTMKVRIDHSTFGDRFPISLLLLNRTDGPDIPFGPLS